MYLCVYMEAYAGLHMYTQSHRVHNCKPIDKTSAQYKLTLKATLTSICFLNWTIETFVDHNYMKKKNQQYPNQINLR